MHFATLLEDSLVHSSNKVYLRAVRFLHIDNGLPDPLINCLQLQRLLRGIKHMQGSSTPKCLSIPIDILQVIKCSPNLYSRDHVMLWATCYLCFTGFLRAGEFATNSLFDSSIHLGLNWCAGQFLGGSYVFQNTSSARRQIWQCLALLQGPCFATQMIVPSHVSCCCPEYSLFYIWQTFWVVTLAVASVFVLPQQQHPRDSSRSPD